MSQADQQFLDALRYLGQQGQQYGVKQQMDQVNQRANEIRSTMQDEVQKRQALRNLASQAAVSVSGSGGNALQAAAIENLLPPIPTSVQQAYLQGSLMGDQQMVGVAQDALRQEEAAKIRLMEKQAALDLMKLAEQQKGAMSVEMRQVRKENRATAQELQASRDKAVQALKNLNEIERIIKRSTLVGTGPIDQASRYFSSDAQTLERLMGQVSLDNMVSMFNGMSKAVDTGAERQAFERTQLGLNKYEATNLDTIKQQRQLYQQLLRKVDKKMTSFKATGGLSFDYSDVADVPEEVEKTAVTSKIKSFIQKR